MVIERMICLSNGSSAMPVEVRQNDYNAVEVQLLVYETPKMLLDMTGLQATVSYEKDGIVSEPFEAEVQAKNYLLYTFPASQAKEAGKGKMQITLYSEEAVVHSYTLPYVVEHSIAMPAPGMTKDPAPAFFTLIKDAQAAVKETENVAQIGQDSMWYIWNHEAQAYQNSGKPSLPTVIFKVETGKPGTEVTLEQSGTPQQPEVKLVIPPGRDALINGLAFFDADPLPLGETNSGSSMQMARGDHVHPLPKVEELAGILPIEKGGTGTNTIEQLRQIVGGYSADNALQMSAVSVVLEATKWEEGSELYKQTVTVEKMTADTAVTSAIVTPAADRVMEQRYQASMVRASEQGEGTITFTATEQPNQNIEVNVLVLRIGAVGEGGGSSSGSGGESGGAAETAQRLATPRAISLSGEATGTVQFDGSQDVTLQTNVERLSNEDLEGMLI